MAFQDELTVRLRALRVSEWLSVENLSVDEVQSVVATCAGEFTCHPIVCISDATKPVAVAVRRDA